MGLGLLFLQNRLQFGRCPEPGNPGPGLVYIEELHGRTVNVEFIGTDLVLNAPGEFVAFPAMDDVGSCNIP